MAFQIFETEHLRAVQIAEEYNIQNPHFRNVLHLTSARTGIPIERILSKLQKRRITYARYLALYLLHDFLQFTPQNISDELGVNRATVYAGRENIKAGIDNILHVRLDVEALREELRASAA